MTYLAVEKYKSEFGDTFYHFCLDGTLFIVLNSQLYFDVNECKSLLEEQNKWLDAILEREAKKFTHVIVLQHHPLFLKSIDEDNTYFNLPIEVRKLLLDKFRKAGVKKVFTGHYHGNAIGKHEEFECIVTSAIGLQLVNKGGKLKIKTL